MRRARPLLVLTCALTVGCSTVHRTDAAATTTTATLSTDVDHLQTAAIAGDRATAQTAAQQLRADVATAVSTGTLTAQRATQITAQIDAVLLDITAQPTPNAAAANTSAGAPATSSEPLPPAPSPDKGKGKGEGDGSDGKGGN